MCIDYKKITLSLILLFLTNIGIQASQTDHFTAYLFAYFTGNNGDEESIRFAISGDGHNFLALNDNNPIINSADIAVKKAVRDPHILRCEDGRNFYMVVTDMRSAEGWSSNRGIVLLKSSDLIHWTSSRVDLSTTFPAFADINRAWAPQTIYDPVVQKYMIYFSMRKAGGIDVVYYAYANSDFTALETIPVPLYNSPLNKSCIDADIIAKDGKYYMFHKTEGDGNGIKCAISHSVTGPYVIEKDDFVDQSPYDVEGSCVYQLIESKEYMLIYDVYNKGKYEFCTSTDLENFKVTEGSTNFWPRHGTVIPITQAESDRLIDKWGANLAIKINTSLSPFVKIENAELGTTNIYLPLKSETDLSSFDPQLSGTVGISKITPIGAQDFTKGSVNYQVTAGSLRQNYTVRVSIDNNPIVEGYFADPEIIYSHKNKKFHLYSTTDGTAKQGGICLRSFSSPNLIRWQDEGDILNLSTDVSWANANISSPSIVEVNYGDFFRYYCYYTADKKIGVAVANDPIGPYVAQDTPLISQLPVGITVGQCVNPDVYTDPISRKNYLYWGERYLAVAELNDDMVSINTSTQKLLTVNSTYQGGVHVFNNKGIYYFLWCENDASTPNYRVRYGTSLSPEGPISIPQNNLILSKDAPRGIYGTGNCVTIQVNDTDWYLAYQRFSRPNAIFMGDASGYHREICIDKMQFNVDGSIKPILSTLVGIDSVTYAGPLLPITPIPSNINETIIARRSIKNSYYTLTGIFCGTDKSCLSKGIYLLHTLYDDDTIKTQIIYK